eukprot:TRINITY_DN37486_c0_g1_i1.p2 TRINITY_DN37486_c0_g1~~TRINITY_DN37486_c0_g1_i1.p2  ORF type:complete len:430 (+),score=112.14 TRINITY_DN37486_c0_g1_i1:120-1409(+)
MQYPRLDALDALRWVASVQIVLSHIYPELGKYAEQGKLLTQMFFILSGFVLAIAEMARPRDAKPMGIVEYQLKRLASLYPAYAFCLLSQGFLVAHSRSFGALNAFQKLLFPVSLLLGQSIYVFCHPEFPATNQTSCFQWNCPTWFISALTVYWLTLRPAARFFRDMSLRAACAWWLLFWAASMVPEYGANYIASLHNGNPWGDCRLYNITHGCLGYFHVFLGGVVLARIFMLTCCKDAETGEEVTADTSTMVLAPEQASVIFHYGCIIGYAIYYYIVHTLHFPLSLKIFFVVHNGGLLPIFSLLIFGASLGEDPIAKYLFKSRVMRFLGRMSVYQYLLQYVVRDYITASFPGLGVKWTFGTKLLYPVVLLFSSFMLETFVQKPVQRVYERLLLDVRPSGGQRKATEKSALLPDATSQAGGVFNTLKLID